MFNKHFPYRRPEPVPKFSNVDRAVFFRLATWISTLMLITGYVIIYVLWT
jgi:hypothetical protein